MAEHDIRIEANPRWIRGVTNGRTVIDTRASQYVWTHPYYPAWFIPVADVSDASLAARSIGELEGYINVEWDAVDHWFEEDVEVFVHPRDPYKRIDALPSSRHVRVFIGDTVVADTTKPTVLYETLLPPRYYLPATDVRLDLFTPTDTSTACPYKGWANYWTATIDGVEHPDIVWAYRTPLPESEAIAGMVCFYNEKVDIEVDGTMLERPETVFT